MTFDQTQALLNKTFDGFIQNQSTTAAFKFQQLSIAIDKTKEQVGAALLPAVTSLTNYILTNVVPVVQSFVNGLTGQNGLAAGLSKSQISAIEWGNKVRAVIDTVIEFKEVLIATAIAIGTIFVVSKIAAGVVATIALINTLIKAYNLLKASAIVAGVASAFALNPLLGVGATALAAGVLAGANALANKSNTSTASSGSSAGGFSGTMPNGQSFNTGVASAANSAAAASKAAASTSGATRSATAGSSGSTINLNVNGAIDPEGTARTIVNTLNNSYYRGTGGATTLQLLQ